MSNLAARRLQVLIAEDHPSSQAVLTQALQALDAEVTPVANGFEAVRAYGRQAFDLILMDLQMPVMDGYEAIRMIRALEARTRRKPVPVVVVSAHDRPADVAAATAAGADMHVAKPVSVPTLLGAIDAVTAPAS
jgi:CheY-like chemotaxis protein